MQGISFFRHINKFTNTEENSWKDVERQEWEVTDEVGGPFTLSLPMNFHFKVDLHIPSCNFKFVWPANHVCAQSPCVQLFETPQTVAHQAPLSMGFSRQEYWSRLPFPPPGDLPDPEFQPTSLASPALASGIFTTAPPGNPSHLITVWGW